MLYRQDREDRLLVQPGLDLCKLAQINFFERGIVNTCFSLSIQHGTLAGENFIDWPLHQDNAVIIGPIGWELAQEHVNDFDDVPACLFKPAFLVAQPFHRFELKITAGIAFVGRSQVVRQCRQAARAEHLHHERGAGTRKPAYDRDDGIGHLRLLGSPAELSEPETRCWPLARGQEPQAFLAYFRQELDVMLSMFAHVRALWLYLF